MDDDEYADRTYEEDNTFNSMKSTYIAPVLHNTSLVKYDFRGVNVSEILVGSHHKGGTAVASG